MDINEVYTIISENVKYYRMNNLRYGYVTQEDLSRISRVSFSLIRNIENRQKINGFNLVAINNIAKSLDIPLYKFFMRNNS